MDAADVTGLSALALAGVVCASMVVSNIVIRRARKTYPAVSGVNVPLVTKNTYPTVAWLAGHALAAVVLPQWVFPRAAPLLAPWYGSVVRRVACVASGVWMRHFFGEALWFAMLLWRLQYLVHVFTGDAFDPAASPEKAKGRFAHVPLFRAQQWLLFAMVMLTSAVLCTVATVDVRVVDQHTCELSTALGVVFGVYTAACVLVSSVFVLTLWGATPGTQFGDYRAFGRAVAALWVLQGVSSVFSVLGGGAWAHAHAISIAADALATAALYAAVVAHPMRAAITRDAEFERSFYRWFRVFYPDPSVFDYAMQNAEVREDFIEFLESSVCVPVRTPVRLVSGRTAVYRYVPSARADGDGGVRHISVLVGEERTPDSPAPAPRAPMRSLPRTFLVQDNMPSAEIVLEVRPRAIARAMRTVDAYREIAERARTTEELDRRTQLARAIETMVWGWARESDDAVVVPVLDGPGTGPHNGGALPSALVEHLRVQMHVLARQLYYGEYCARGRAALSRNGGAIVESSMRGGGGVRMAKPLPHVGTAKWVSGELGRRTAMREILGWTPGDRRAALSVASRGSAPGTMQLLGDDEGEGVHVVEPPYARVVPE